MTLYGLLAVGIVCITVAGLSALVLAHLKALHLTKSQEVVLTKWVNGALEHNGEKMREIVKDLEDTKVKLATLGNRVR